jgi:hypothetical protein
MVNEIVIEARYDEEARVWVAVHDELGLATEAETLDVLTYKRQVARPVNFTLHSIRRATAFA